MAQWLVFFAGDDETSAWRVASSLTHTDLNSRCKKLGVGFALHSGNFGLKISQAPVVRCNHRSEFPGSLGSEFGGSRNCPICSKL
jgi:hypothetical protein